MAEPAADEYGLREEEALELLKEHGANRVEVRHEVSFGEIFLEEVREPMILLLLLVTAGYFLLGETLEAVAVLLIVTAILFVEVWTEYRAKSSVASLEALAEPSTLVRREGTVKAIAVDEVVPGDLLVLKAGSRIPADGRLVEAYDLAVDESALSGESLPVDKIASVAPEKGQNLVFRGTMVVRGEGLARVTATGLKTEIGRIAGLTRAAKPPRTPLQQMMKQLSQVLAVAALIAAAVIPLLSVLIGGQDWSVALLTGLSLAFATIPEELPILVVMVLGLGSLRLARSNALVRRLYNAETLGHVTAVITDKTGTLTQNRQQFAGVCFAGQRSVTEITATADSRRLNQVLYLSLLSPETQQPVPGNDPLEVALAEAVSVSEAEIPNQPFKRLPFSAARGWSGIVWGENRRAVKGVPEIVLKSCRQALLIRNGAAEEVNLTDDLRDEILEQVDRLAADGYRLLGVAGDAVFLGLAAFTDPLRPEAAQAVNKVQAAGIKVLMATGDHPAFARSIARQIGLPADRVVTGEEIDCWDEQELARQLKDTRVFARIRPEHKLRLVQALQQDHEVVAMIGDGINDAPAIKAADAGVAMGLSGTDAARESAGIILTDDRFATMALAIHEGRGLFNNLQKAVRYYLAIKLALVVSMLVPAVLGLTPPFSPIMIILMELFMDLAASAAFVIEPAEEDLMARPPRPVNRPFLDQTMTRSIVTGGLALAIAVLAAIWAAPEAAAEVVHSAGFIAWMWGHVLLAYIFRYMHTPPYRHAFQNPVLNTWAGAALATAVVVISVPLIQTVFGTAALSPAQWAWSLGVPMIMAVLLAAGRNIWQGAEN